MTTANINWSFNPRAGATPVVNCTFIVSVTRDGAAAPSFSVSTNSAGFASGVYQDPAASATLTHVYRLTPQMTGCAANCTASAFAVNWNCAGTAPVIPVDVGIVGCPVQQDTFNRCGGTDGPQQVAIGATVSLMQNFGNATSVSISPSVPGLTATTTAAGGTLSGVVTTAGTYNVKFTGSKAGCADCSITYPLIVGAASSAVQSIIVSRGPSAYTPVSPTVFNAADQVLTATITGPRGQTFNLVGTGTVNVVTQVFTMPDTGVFTYSTPVGQGAAYSTSWSFVAAGSSPVSLSNPAAVIITGSTCLSLAVTQAALAYTITVTAPPGAAAVPFTLDFGGATFASSSPVCSVENFGVSNAALTTSSGGGVNVFTYGPVSVTAPYSAAIRLRTNAGSASTHVVCGTACATVNFP